MPTILCAVDFSDDGKGVITTAAAEAKLRGAKLWLVHVAAPEPDFVGYEPGPDNERQFRAEELRAEHEMLHERVEQLKGEGVEAASLLIEGSTTEVLVEQAKELTADLIVIGSHRHGLWHRALWGSTESSVIEHANCPVLVVPVTDA